MIFDNYKHMEEVIKSCSLPYSEDLYKQIIVANFSRLRVDSSVFFRDTLNERKYWTRKIEEVSETSLCPKCSFSLQCMSVYSDDISQLKISNDKIEILDIKDGVLSKQKLLTDKKTNKILSIEFDYYDKVATNFIYAHSNEEYDWVDNLKQITEEKEIIPDLKFIITNEVKEDRKVKIECIIGNITVFGPKTCYIKTTNNFYYLAKLFVDELNVPEFFNDKDLSKVLTKIEKCVYF